MYEATLKETLPEVLDRVADALERAGRRDAVTIVAVTKGHPLEAVHAALTTGLHRLGENRVQELEEKVEAVGREGPEWHLIGHLQRNKVRRGIELFDYIHSVDSLRLARTLSREAERAGTEVRGLAQVNVSGEATKGGFEAAEALDALGEIVALPGLRIEGLMTMAPLTEDEAVLRRTFADTRRLLERAAEQLDGLQGRELSMGMSNDFEIAIEEGATLVRLGTVLFGERPQ